MKRLVCLLLSVLLLTGILSGLASASSGEIADVDFSEHEEYTIWLQSDPNDYYSDYSDNPVIVYLYNKFNVTLKYEQPATGTEADSLSLMFGTGQYTDLVSTTYYTGSVRQLYEDGVIVDIAEYLDYMPNFKALLDGDDDFRKHAYTDDGKILQIPGISTEPELIWGSMVYRYDILDTMTGGNVAFPSGNESPTTPEDWDYMLPLFKAYFDAAGMADSAALILPYNSVFYYGEMLSGFGTSGPVYYVEDGKVSRGYLDDGFYDYLVKMNEWYEAGYIYQDFASRVNDLFYLPNTSLTYGGAAGAWFGMITQLGDVMSMPDYGLYFDVRAAVSPLNEGVALEDTYVRNPSTVAHAGLGYVLTKACDNIPKFLTILDYMFSEEGALLFYYGLNADQLADSNGLYERIGLEDGAYWFEGEDFVFNPNIAEVGGTINRADIMASTCS